MSLRAVALGGASLLRDARARGITRNPDTSLSDSTSWEHLALRCGTKCGTSHLANSQLIVMFPEILQ
jgi:hypothetical protein